MKHAKILDCTLRDGAYLVDKTFGGNTIKGIINGLMQTGIDYIEIGFLQDDGLGDGKTVYKVSSDASKYIPHDKNGCEFAVLADYSRYSINNLDINTGGSFDIVRECFFKEERADALKVCKTIKEKGYKVFVQPVDILGYSDNELLELIEMVNVLEPYCFSIVDTFGSMYIEDLKRIFSLIDHNLTPDCHLGFHSHNNMQLSNALSQEFLSISLGKREVIIDSTLCGMGRGAGNTPTELITEYMVSHLKYGYNLDALLDTIDGYMDNIMTKCSWGYTIPYFIAGANNSHVNNISHLLNKNSIRSKDMRYILNKIDAASRKRYDYDLLDSTYYEYLQSDINDSIALKSLSKKLHDKNLLLIAPGKSANQDRASISRFIEASESIVITVNFLHETIPSDYFYSSNNKRYNYWSQAKGFASVPKILTSNITDRKHAGNSFVVSLPRLIKCGWEHSDNALIMLLRLLDIIEVKQIAIAGFDGYSFEIKDNSDFANPYMESHTAKVNPFQLNKDITEMLQDYLSTRMHKTPVIFVTKSRFEDCFKKETI